jgi:hypothetical protein
MQSRFRKSLTGVTDMVNDVVKRVNLEQLLGNRKLRQAIPVRFAQMNQHFESLVGINVNEEVVDPVDVNKTIEAEIKSHNELSLETLLEERNTIEEKLLELHGIIVDARRQAPDTYVDPVVAHLLQPRPPENGGDSVKVRTEKQLESEERRRIHSALHNFSKARERNEQFQGLERDWMDKYQGTVGADPHLGCEARSSDDVSAVDVSQLTEHIEDDMYQEPPKVALKPPISNLGIETSLTYEGRNSTPPWKRQATAQVTVDGRFHRWGKKESGGGQKVLVPKSLRKAASDAAQSTRDDSMDEVPIRGQKRPVCRFYAKGRCRYGNKCSFFHPNDDDDHWW